MPRGRIENLKPIKTSEEAKKKGSAGGKVHAKMLKDRKLVSMIYAEMLSEKYKIKKPDGSYEVIDGDAFLKDVVKHVLARSDAASVAMLKEIRESTEGQHISITGKDGEPGVKLEMNPKARADLIADLVSKYGEKPC